MNDGRPKRGEIWLLNLNPVLGHEQGGTRPGLVVSHDRLNRGPADLAIVIPITTVEKGISSHVRVDPPEGGLREASYIKTEDIRSVSISRRFHQRWGGVQASTMQEVEFHLRRLLNLK